MEIRQARKSSLSSIPIFFCGRTSGGEERTEKGSKEEKEDSKTSKSSSRRYIKIVLGEL